MNLDDFPEWHARQHQRSRSLYRWVLLATWALLFFAVGAALVTLYWR